ncbi:MAG: transcriptional repressor [Chloroflexi bacterium RBG_16_60_22]|nr:MAG: transcriptional repressor [Chloroflexi bacterium RBG_16_60_22]
MHETSGIVGRLSQKGYRLTPQRLMILSAIEGSEDHISAEEIYAQVAASYPHVNISTVYRTLELLKKLGMVYEIDLGEGRIRYHAEGSGHHHHLVCQNCNRVIDIDESTLSSLRDILLRDYSFRAELRHVAIFGFCEDCRRGRSGKGAGADAG